MFIGRGHFGPYLFLTYLWGQKMKYRINLTPYPIDFERWAIVDGERKLEKGQEPLEVKNELYSLLRIPGIYKDGIETCDGVDLANRIKASEDSLDITAENLELLKRVFNKLIAQEHNPAVGQMAMGGPRYLELIQRVFKAEEISD